MLRFVTAAYSHWPIGVYLRDYKLAIQPASDERNTAVNFDPFAWGTERLVSAMRSQFGHSADRRVQPQLAITLGFSNGGAGAWKPTRCYGAGSDPLAASKPLGDWNASSDHWSYHDLLRCGA